MEQEARRFAELTAQLAASRGKRVQAESLLADAAAIERDAGRLAELERVIPLAETAVRERAGVEESERGIAGKVAEQQRTSDEVRNSQQPSNKLARNESLYRRTPMPTTLLARRVDKECPAACRLDDQTRID